MGSVLAIVSKKVFEKEFRAAPNQVVATAAYTSTHKTLEALAAGGDLFLVTVAAGEQLWLVGVLRKPKFAGGAWKAAPNTVPITDVTALVGQLRFESGNGITARPGALAMSLQTPRGLTEADVALLDGAKPAKTAAKPAARPAAKRGTKTTTAKPATKPPTKTTGVKPAALEMTASSAAKPAVSKLTANSAAEKPATAFKMTASSAADAKPAKLGAAKPAAKPAAGSDPDLAKAHAHLAAGALVPALDDLLRAWARCRSAEVADLIEHLGGEIASSLPAIAGNKNTIDAAWRDVGDLVRPADVPRLAIALDQGSAPQAEGWLDILLRFPIDPRLCAPAIDMSLKFVSSTTSPTRTRAFKLAETIADGRCLPQIEAILKQKRGAWNWTELKDRVRKMQTKFKPVPALPAGDATAVKAVDKAIAAIAKRPPLAEAALFAAAPAAEDDGARLLNEVLDDPQNDAPRLVYADYLLQHDDPRGELITLQMLRHAGTLTRAQADRERALLRDKRNVERWLGPLVAVVKNPVFERGFLHDCTVELKSARHRNDLVLHPLWATVESISCTELALVDSPGDAIAEARLRPRHRDRARARRSQAAAAVHRARRGLVRRRRGSRRPTGVGDDPRGQVAREAASPRAAVRRLGHGRGPRQRSRELAMARRLDTGAPDPEPRAPPRLECAAPQAVARPVRRAQAARAARDPVGGVPRRGTRQGAGLHRDAPERRDQDQARARREPRSEVAGGARHPLDAVRRRTPAARARGRVDEK